MSPRPDYILLCRLLDSSLRPFSHLGAESLTQEMEKELLIALSQVFTQVNKWTHQFGSQSKFDTDEELDLSDNRHCLAKIIGDLVFLFAVNNPYAQHLVGNTLLAISKFVIAGAVGKSSFIFCVFSWN